jgi:gluconolactonase
VISAELAGIGLQRTSVLAGGLDHPEGVAWDPTTHSIYAGGEGGQIYALKPGESPRCVLTCEAFFLGLAVDGSGYLYACDAAGKRVLRIDVRDASHTTYTTGTASHQMSTPNWPVFGRDGSLYVTDSGEWGSDDGLIYRVGPDGETELWSSALAAFPNGACLTHDGASLAVVESTNSSISVVPILPDGSAGTPSLLARVPGTVPDGIAPASDGSFFVTCYRPDCLYQIAPTRAVTLVLNDPAGTRLAAPTNVAFFGVELDRAVIANLGRWHLTSADLGVSGHPLCRPSLATRSP